MLEKYFSAPKTLRRLRGGISGPHIDGFADDLEREGYAPAKCCSIHSSGRPSRLFRSAEMRRFGGHRSQHPCFLQSASSPLPMSSFQARKD